MQINLIEALKKQINELNRLHDGSSTQDKDLNDIDVLISIKNTNNEITKVSDDFDLIIFLFSIFSKVLISFSKFNNNLEGNSGNSSSEYK